MRPARAADGPAWVTGATAGIGRATALHLVARGWRVIATARGAEALAALARAHPDSILPAPADITDPRALAAALAAAEARVGRSVALAVLNAGTYEPMDAAAFDLARFRRQIEVNLLGTAHSLAAVMPGMIGRGQGQIGIVASVAGYRGLPTSLAYGPSKAALINLAEALRLELAPHGVMASLIDPGFVRTPLTERNRFPMPFLMEPEAAAARLVRGLASGRFETTFPRRFTWAMKLLRILPYPLYLALARRALPDRSPARS